MPLGEWAWGGLTAATRPPPFLQDLTRLIPQTPAASLHQPLCDVSAPPAVHGVTLAWPPLDSALHVVSALSTSSTAQQARAWALKGSEPRTGRRSIGEAGKELVTARWRVKGRGPRMLGAPSPWRLRGSGAALSQEARALDCAQCRPCSDTSPPWPGPLLSQQGPGLQFLP